MDIENTNIILNRYLDKKLTIAGEELVFSFETPSKTWMNTNLYKDSANIVNIYLLEVKDNLELRNNKYFHDSNTERKKLPFFIDLYYILTFYNTNKTNLKERKNKEHEYLSKALLALYDFYDLAKSTINDTNFDSFIENIKLDLFPKPYIDEHLGLQLWSALEQDARPFISLKVTIALESSVPKQGTKTVKKDGKEITMSQYPSKNNSLYGRVFSEREEILTHEVSAIVEITKKGDDKIIYTTKTNELGVYEFMQFEKMKQTDTDTEVLVVKTNIEGYTQAEVEINFGNSHTIEMPINLTVKKLP